MGGRISTSELLRRWWRIPVLRKDGLDWSRKATWLELFFDLVYVWIVAELVHVLAADVTWKGVGAFVVWFLPILWLWIGSTIYNNRFDNDGASHRWLVFVKMLPIAGMAVYAHQGIEAGAVGFASFYALSRMLLAFSWMRAGWHNNAAVRKVAGRFAGASLVSALLWIGSIFVPQEWRYVLWIASIFVDMGAPFLTFRLQEALPQISSVHILERYGLFTLIMLGESVLGVMRGISDTKNLTLTSFLVASIGMLIAFGLWWMYFDNGTTESPRLSGKWSIIRGYTHAPLMLGLAAVGGAVLELATYGTELLTSAHNWLLVSGVALAMLSMALIERAQSTTAEDGGLRYKLAKIRAVSAVGVVLLGVVAQLLSMSVSVVPMSIIVFLGVALIVVLQPFATAWLMARCPDGMLCRNTSTQSKTLPESGV